MLGVDHMLEFMVVYQEIYRVTDLATKNNLLMAAFCNVCKILIKSLKISDANLFFWHKVSKSISC